MRCDACDLIGFRQWAMSAIDKNVGQLEKCFIFRVLDLSPGSRQMERPFLRQSLRVLDVE